MINKVALRSTSHAEGDLISYGGDAVITVRRSAVLW
jgi:hypothetical protein